MAFSISICPSCACIISGTTICNFSHYIPTDSQVWEKHSMPAFFVWMSTNCFELQFPSSTPHPQPTSSLATGWLRGGLLGWWRLVRVLAQNRLSLFPLQAADPNLKWKRLSHPCPSQLPVLIGLDMQHESDLPFSRFPQILSSKAK